jgi:hypothetical protein
VGGDYFPPGRYWASQRAEGYSDAERTDLYLPVLMPACPLARSGVRSGGSLLTASPDVAALLGKNASKKELADRRTKTEK